MKPSERVIVSTNFIRKQQEKIEQLEKKREQAVTLIKDGRFIEALRVLENDR